VIKIVTPAIFLIKALPDASFKIISPEVLRMGFQNYGSYFIFILLKVNLSYVCAKKNIKHSKCCFQTLCSTAASPLICQG
jgi:hypothetical protein